MRKKLKKNMTREQNWKFIMIEVNEKIAIEHGLKRDEYKK